MLRQVACVGGIDTEKAELLVSCYHWYSNKCLVIAVVSQWQALCGPGILYKDWPTVFDHLKHVPAGPFILHELVAGTELAAGLALPCVVAFEYAALFSVRQLLRGYFEEAGTSV